MQSGISRHIQGHSAILSHAQVYWGALRHIVAYSGFEPHGAIIKHIQSSA